MKLTLEVWRQKNGGDKGGFSTYELEDVDTHMSFLEMLDVLNQDLIVDGEEPIAFEHDCREGICGACGFVVNGVAHGHQKGSTICQLHMRHFSDGDKITIEPWRAKAFPIIKDLVVDRSSFDRILQAGGFVTIRTGSAPDANALPVATDILEHAMDFAE
ncbi:MAG: succinate dehydrogenase/fumarate reductase iron-sulfur subunit, partial [Acidobacteria bacterium]|nr:succinate dehydrogenase/fumarate reductase iron-sulfur subunit [Candidatus Sulfomarinibacter sp. MAG AM1]